MTDWEPHDPAVVAWIERAVGHGSRLVSAARMPASSTEKHLIRVEREDGSRMDLVLRRFHDPERLGIDPWYVAANEARALELLGGTRVPAPHLVAADTQAEVCDVPALLESWVPGEQAWDPSDLDGYLRGAAEVLVAIHDLAVPSAMPAYRPYFTAAVTGPPIPAWSTRRSMWERVFARIDPVRPASPARFIHRDYHPGNALWDGERVTGIVDWATAAAGPAGIDLARMRQNLAGWHGRAVADRFTAWYVRAGGDPAARDPFWDLLDAADSVAFVEEPGAPGEGDVEGFEDYVASVLAEL